MIIEILSTFDILFFCIVLTTHTVYLDIYFPYLLSFYSLLNRSISAFCCDAPRRNSGSYLLTCPPCVGPPGCGLSPVRRATGWSGCSARGPRPPSPSARPGSPSPTARPPVLGGCTPWCAASLERSSPMLEDPPLFRWAWPACIIIIIIISSSSMTIHILLYRSNLPTYTHTHAHTHTHTGHSAGGGASEGRASAGRGPCGGAEGGQMGLGVRPPVGRPGGHRGVQGAGLRDRQGSPQESPAGAG